MKNKAKIFPSLLTVKEANPGLENSSRAGIFGGSSPNLPCSLADPLI